MIHHFIFYSTHVSFTSNIHAKEEMECILDFERLSRTTNKQHANLVYEGVKCLDRLFSGRRPKDTYAHAIQKAQRPSQEGCWGFSQLFPALQKSLSSQCSPLGALSSIPSVSKRSSQEVYHIQKISLTDLLPQLQ